MSSLRNARLVQCSDVQSLNILYQCGSVSRSWKLSRVLSSPYGELPPNPIWTSWNIIIGTQQTPHALHPKFVLVRDLSLP